ncbi:MAG: ATP-grasp domain-containing protein [Bacteroides sp.]|nr:ATP-grasp domain-containing protein [Bacteroides sp.]
MSQQSELTQTRRNLNVLFLGGAKRVSFGNKLIDAGRRLGIDVKIYSYELESEVPVALIGGVIIGRRWSAPDILDHLHQVVGAYRIDVLLPFVDGAISIAGAYVATHGDAWSPVVGSGKAEILFDKVLSAKEFERVGLDIPPTYTGGRPVFPLIAKPRHGSASKGIEVIDSINEFRRISKVADEYLIQAYYPDRKEYTVDCYISRSGETLCISPRQRLEVVGGEVSRTVTVDFPALLEASADAIAKLGLRGAVTLQYLLDIDTDRLMLMEINPRLGGGVVCSIHAGADIPGMILSEASGLHPQAASDICPGTMICRYFEEAVFNV